MSPTTAGRGGRSSSSSPSGLALPVRQERGSSTVIAADRTFSEPLSIFSGCIQFEPPTIEPSGMPWPSGNAAGKQPMRHLLARNRGFCSVTGRRAQPRVRTRSGRWPRSATVTPRTGRSVTKPRRGATSRWSASTTTSSKKAADALRPVLDLPPTQHNRGIVVSAQRVQRAAGHSPAHTIVLAQKLREEIAQFFSAAPPHALPRWP